MAQPDRFPLVSSPENLAVYAELLSEATALAQKVILSQEKHSELLGRTLECFKRHLK